MTRAPRPVKPPPLPPHEVQRIDEANVGRLGLISIQERIPESFTSWSVDFEVEGRAARLSCDSLPKYGGVPHGLDGDIATALVDLYVESGCPADGVVHTSAYQILKRAGLDDSGRYYRNLKLSLFRLRTSTYSASEAWRDHTRRTWTTVTFNYLEALEFSSQDDELRFSRASVLKIRLAESIVRSIRADYTKPLDLAFLTSLDRPLTRALYRLLDARRSPPEDPRTQLPAISVNLIAWGEACKILDQRTNKIRSTLQGAHEELIERGFLSAVEYEGRGRKQIITYTFAGHERTAAPAGPPSAAAAALLSRRVSAPVALRLVEEFGEARVLERLSKFVHLIDSGYKVRNGPAVLVDVIRDDASKYPDPEGFVGPVQQARVASARAALSRVAQQGLEAQEQAMSAEEQLDAALKTVQFLLRERLKTSEYARLRERLALGTLDAAEMQRQVTRAKVEGRLDEIAQELVRTLGSAD